METGELITLSDAVLKLSIQSMQLIQQQAILQQQQKRYKMNMQNTNMYPLVHVCEYRGAVFIYVFWLDTIALLRVLTWK